MIITLYLASFSAFLFVAYWTRRLRGISWIIDPFGLVGITFGVMYMLSPAFMIGMNAFKYQSGYTDLAYLLGLGYVVAFGTAMWLGFLCIGGNDITVSAIRDDMPGWQPYSRLQLGVTLALCLLPVLYSAIVLGRLLSEYGVAVYLADRISLTRGSGYALMGLNWPLSLSLLTYATYRQREVVLKDKFSTLGLGLMLALGSLCGLLQGSRTATILPFIFLFLASLHIGKATRILSRRTLPIVAVVVAAVFLGSVRQQLMSGAELQFDRSAMKSVTSRTVLSLGEVENLFWMADHGVSVQPLYGTTFAAIVAGVVPRRLWPEKPVGGGPHLRNMIVPGSYNLATGTQLTSYTPGLPAEAFLNFSWFGALLVGGLYGALLGLLTIAAQRLRDPVGYSGWLITFFSAVFLLKGEAFGVTARLFVLLVPLAIAAFVRWFVPASSISDSPRNSRAWGALSIR